MELQQPEVKPAIVEDNWEIWRVGKHKSLIELL